MPKRALPPPFSVVGIGASAGGLEACGQFLDALPSQIGMAFILVQHLDPTHKSLMAELLAKHTKMVVVEAVDGIRVEPDHLYVIPPGTYLAASKGVLRLTEPTARHGARLPFDFLLNSLAKNYGSGAIAVVLSGTGADGSIGVKAIKEEGGFVLAQDPDEADYGGMPGSAIAVGAVDLILPAAEIGNAILHRVLQHPSVHETPDTLLAIVELLRTTTVHDFTLYKMGTLKRRIERRMALAGIKDGKMMRYLEILRGDAKELDLLAKDLLINVTSYFRDPKVFEHLGAKIIPNLVAAQPVDLPLRVWIAGCSSGEEAYSLAMLFCEAIDRAKSNIKLQIFASDVDADAVAIAREGLYPHTIEADVSPERLARFFSCEDHGYRVSSQLRAAVVFTVQDLLADPPFSRLDFVSCRNLLIYLGPEAQASVIALFHFALRTGGMLLLGNAETIGPLEEQFEVVSKSDRLYRQIGRSHPGKVGRPMVAGEITPFTAPTLKASPLVHQADLAELCRRLVIETHAPAAVLINRTHICLFSLGPTDRYLRISPGHPSHDVLDMVPQALRIRLRSAIQQVSPEKTPIIVAGGKVGKIPFNIDIRSVQSDGEELLLICFVDAPVREARRGAAALPVDSPRIADLEQELDATRTELQGAIHSLEISGEEQRAINEEALSVNEEFQSTNEELLTSKEELQSLNEELTALNSQLQETLERQRTTSNDLQNVLFSTDVATLFLDLDLNIRFFTPATKSLFNIIPSDIGRPLSDLRSLASDILLSDDARAVLQGHAPIDREIETGGGVWFMRRIMPYRADDDGIEGVVISFNDITESKSATKLVDDAKKVAELATVAKSRFLAVASHDLRQPLQTLALLQGLLGKTAQGEKAQQLIARLDETLGAMTGMLNTLLDINQIDAGTVQPEISRFAINDLLDGLRDEFSYHAQAKNLEMRVVHCVHEIETDRRLLEQMLRNLISNAIKYTKSGKILVGCRHFKNKISIEVFDTGIGIADAEIEAIFDEYHQIGNAARERSRGLGLGLSIVQRLGKLLNHPVHVRSAPGQGSAFAIEVMRPAAKVAAKPDIDDDVEVVTRHRTGTLLIVDDDPEVRVLLDLLLRDEGHQTLIAEDGLAALKMLTGDGFKPDLILSDYNLPNNMDGLQLSMKLRETLGPALPIIILTGDISTETMRDVARQNCVQLNKPVKAAELSRTIQRLLPYPD